MTDDIDAIVQGLSKALREAVRWLDGEAWSTSHEPCVTGMALSLLCTKAPPLADRRWSAALDVYEYRLTPRGIAVRNRVMAQKGGDV